MMNGIMADTLSHFQPFARIIPTAGSIAERGASLLIIVSGSMGMLCACVSWIAASAAIVAIIRINFVGLQVMSVPINGRMISWSRIFPWFSTASAELLLGRMHSKIDDLCAQRDRLKKEQPAERRVLGGRSW
jgi:hypothetical protein